MPLRLPDTSNSALSRWALTPVITAAIHLAALWLSGWLAAVIISCEWPRSGIPFPLWVWGVGGLVAAGLALPQLETAFSQTAGRPATVWRPVATTSLSVALIVALLLSLDATISSLALLVYFGLALAGDSVRRTWPYLKSPARAADPAQLENRAWPTAHFNRWSYAPWMIGALFLLLVALLNAVVGRSVNAERLANWAYGYLVLGVSIALLFEALRLVRMPHRLRQLALWLTPIGLGVLLAATGFLLERADQPPIVLSDTSALSEPRPAYASLAAYLNQNAQPGDIVLTRDLTVGLACYGLRAVRLAELQPRGDIISQVAAAVAGRRQVFFAYSTLMDVNRRPEHLALEMGGDLIQKLPGVLALEIYAVRPWMGLTGSPVRAADFGPITLRSAAYQPQVQSGGALGIALQFNLNEQSGRSYVKKLVLLDNSGQIVADLEDDILNQAGQATRFWQVAEPAQDSLLLLVPLGTPPLAYQLALELYDENDLTGLAVRNLPATGANRLVPLGPVQVIKPPDFASDPYQTMGILNLAPSQRDWPDVRLLAYRSISTTITPGDTMPLLFRWEARQDHPASQRLRIRVLAGTQIAASLETVIGGDYPIDHWQSGEQVLHRVNLPTLPPAAPGPAKVQFSLDGADWADLGTVTIRDMQRTFIAPPSTHKMAVEFGQVAQLAGYDLTPAGTSDGPIAITLLWRALNPAPLAVRYKVFVHALGADGQILAQSDAEPANWTRPTTSWIAGEIISDTHSLLLPAGYAGSVAFRIGLYDANSLQRIPVGNGDFILLPDKLSAGAH